MIFYVHGFASCAYANEDKLRELSLIFPEEEVQGLNYASEEGSKEILASLIEQVGDSRDNFFIGTSLGGHHAYLLANHFKCMSVALFNPCIDPSKILTSHKIYQNYCTGKPFQISEEVRASYTELQKINNLGTYVFRGETDTLTDWDSGFLSSCKINFIPEGHRISSFVPYERELKEARNYFAI